MTKKNVTIFFENKLLDFVTATDPLLEMLQWVMDKFMEIEVAHKPLCVNLDDWQPERCYMNASSIKLQKEILFNAT